MAWDRGAAFGIAGFAAGWFAAAFLRGSGSGKAGICYVTDLKPSLSPYSFQEDDILEWRERRSGSQPPRGFEIHFKEREVAGNIVYSKTLDGLTVARARAGLRIANGGPTEHGYAITLPGEDRDGEHDEHTSVVTGCPHCPR